MLKQETGGEETIAASNADKGHLLAKGFFPEKPLSDRSVDSATYPPECERAGAITEGQIKQQLKKLKPYKAVTRRSVLGNIFRLFELQDLDSLRSSHNNRTGSNCGLYCER